MLGVAAICAITLLLSWTLVALALLPGSLIALLVLLGAKTLSLLRGARLLGLERLLRLSCLARLERWLLRLSRLLRSRCCNGSCSACNARGSRCCARNGRAGIVGYSLGSKNIRGGFA